MAGNWSLSWIGSIAKFSTEMLREEVLARLEIEGDFGTEVLQHKLILLKLLRKTK